MNKRNHIILDIETLALGDDAYMWELGATAISEEVQDFKNFHSLINNDENNRSIDLSTILWTRDQGNMDAVEDASETDGKSPADVLHDFSEWSAQFHKPLFWSWGSTFDFPILESYYDTFSRHSVPWHYSAVRDLRTLYYALFPESDGLDVRPTLGNTHRALEDAQHEAQLLQKCLEKLKTYED